MPSTTATHSDTFITKGCLPPLSPLLQVIDAEIVRRQLLEESPVPSTNEEPVLFDTAEIPWWAWIRRFHLPEVLSFAWSWVILYPSRSFLSIWRVHLCRAGCAWLACQSATPCR